MRSLVRTAFVVCMVIMVAMTYSTVSFGAGSITDDDNKPVVVGGGGSGGTGTVVIGDIASGSDNSDYVSDIIRDKDITPGEIAARLGEDPTVAKTTGGLPINLELYDRITDFYRIDDGSKGFIDYKAGKNKKVTIQADAVIGLDKSDFLVLIINPKTGKMFLVSPDKFNSETGEMDLTLPSYGMFCIIQKIPIVVRDIHPEEYLDQNVATSVSKLDPESYQELREWLEAFRIYDDELEVADGVVVDVDDYDSANVIADVAVRLSREDFSYDLNTKVWGNLFQDINECDWARVLDYAGVDYDAEKVKDDPTKLTEIEPFVLKDSFVYHVDADTAEVSIAYEPEIYFEICEDMTDIDKQVDNLLNDPEDNKIDINGGEGASLMNQIIPEVYGNDKEYTGEERDIVTFDVEDIDEKNVENLCMVMSSNKYLGMGPFLLFMPKNKAGFAWWWILIILAILVIAFIIYRSRKNKNKAAE